MPTAVFNCDWTAFMFGRGFFIMIYLIACEKTNTCKIGYTNNPDKRLSALQTGNPYSLELMAVIEGTSSDENMLHSKFMDYRLNGEWFDYCEDIKNYFQVDEYFQINMDLLKVIIVMGAVEARIFGYCLQFRNSEFSLSKSDRIGMGKQINANQRTINYTIPLLLEKKVLYKSIDGIYGLNPRYAFYGTLKERNKRLKVLRDLGYADL